MLYIAVLVSIFGAIILAQFLAGWRCWSKAARSLGMPLDVENPLTRRRFIAGELQGLPFAVRMLPPVSVSGVGHGKRRQFYPVCWEVRLVSHPPDVNVKSRNSPNQRLDMLIQGHVVEFRKAFEVRSVGNTEWLTPKRKAALMEFVRQHPDLELEVSDETVQVVQWTKLKSGQLEKIARAVGDLAVSLDLE